MAGPANKGRRPRGAKNYKNKVLINSIAGILPNGQYGWDLVAAAYMTAAKEDILRDTDDLKRHWVKTLCNGMKKPTGGTGKKGERIHKCIAIERLILDKTHLGILGLSPDRDAESKDGGFGSDTSFNNYSAEVSPSPPPPVQDTTGKNKEDEDSELAGINSSITDPQVVTTSRPPSRTTATRPASSSSTSSLKNQKTKNLSNKNKDPTSFAGLIAKLIDLISTSTDEVEQANVDKRMNILMMRQLDLMDRRMERREKEGRKEQRKKKKRQKKKRRKKRAKKAARQVALEDQDDHGG